MNQSNFFENLMNFDLNQSFFKSYFSQNITMSKVPKELFGLKVKVLRSERKTSILYIVGNNLEVRVPNEVSDLQIFKMLDLKKNWIRNKAILTFNKELNKEKLFVSGEHFLFLGRNITLHVLETQKIGVQLNGNNLFVNIRTSEIGELRKSRIKTYIERWYIKEAIKNLEEKVQKYSNIINVYPKRIKVRSYKSRWGSCDTNGQLSFNYNLIKAPHSIIDYVVIHELCHIIQANHSKYFWLEVKKYDPQFKAHRRWLKLNGQELMK